MLSSGVRFSKSRMITSHLFCLLLQIPQAAFPRTIPALYAAEEGMEEGGGGLTVGWRPSRCVHIYSRLFWHIQLPP